jgi:DNA polymerase-1
MPSYPMNVRTKLVAFDTETTGVYPWGGNRIVHYEFGTKIRRHIARRIAPARPFIFSFCDSDGNTDVVRWDVDPITRRVKMGARADEVRAVLADPTITKLGHNLRFDLVMAEMCGFAVNGPCYDTMILAHLATAGSAFTYALKPFCKKYLDYDDADEKALEHAIVRGRARARKFEWSYATQAFAGKKPAKADYWMDRDGLVEAYATGDVIRTILLWKAYHQDVLRDDGLRYLFNREHRLFWVLKRMEARGVRVFPKDIERLERFYNDYIVKQVKVAYANGGRGLNIRSVPQMCQKFYGERGHDAVYTEHGNWSLNGEQLQRLAEKDPLAKATLEIKAAEQVKSVFLASYRRLMVREAPGVWVLHPNFKQTGAATGRLSCGDPNLQQVASETTGRRKAEIAARPREAFGPRPGYLWYMPDYSQIEVWLFAYMSGERGMQDLLMTGYDFHSAVGERVFGEYPDYAEKKSYYRKCAKLIMFLILYGGGAAVLMDLLKTDSQSEAREFLRVYKSKFPGIQRYMDEIIEKANSEGELRNVFGRRYEFDPGFGYRGVNYMIQGTASEVMKNAMIYVDSYLDTTWDGRAYIINTIHDELCIEVPVALHRNLKKRKALIAGIVKEMQHDSARVGLPVPFPVDIKFVYKRWSKADEFKLPPEVRGGAPMREAS